MNYKTWLESGHAMTYQFNGGLADRLLCDLTLICPAEFCSDKTEKRIKITALWDTGATNSGIDTKLAKELNLIPTGRCPVYDAHGLSIVDNHLVNIQFNNGMEIEKINATTVNFVDSEVKMLIGMDVIGLGDFFIGKKFINEKPFTYYSFSVPSIDRDIDFNEELNSKRRAEASVAYTRQQLPKKKKKK